MQYRVPRELSTWWQRAGRAGRRLDVKATAILLAEPCFFDDEKERLAAKSAERALKRAADVQLQPETNKRVRSNNGSRRNVQTSTSTAAATPDRPKIDPEMDDFINAERRLYNCRRKVTSTHFGNVGLGTLIPYLREIHASCHPSISSSDQPLLLRTLQSSPS